MCKLPVMRAPLSGNLPLYCSRAAIKPGISCSASSISLRPNFTVASLRSFTWKGTVLLSESPVSIKVVVLTDGLVVEFVAVAVTGRLQKMLKDERRVRTSAFIRLSGYMNSLPRTCGQGNLLFARIRYLNTGTDPLDLSGILQAITPNAPPSTAWNESKASPQVPASCGEKFCF